MDEAADNAQETWDDYTEAKQKEEDAYNEYQKAREAYEADKNGDTKEARDRAKAAWNQSMSGTDSAAERHAVAREEFRKAAGNFRTVLADHRAELERKGSGWNPDWSAVGQGVGGMSKATVQILVGVAVTQGDSAWPGPLDLVGAGIVVEGAGDMSLNYGIFIGGIMGIDTSDIPDDFANAAVDVITGNDEAGDVTQQVIDFGVDGLRETNP
jgi:hypothetical protein